jgi:hypothetical protein
MLAMFAIVFLFGQTASPSVPPYAAATDSPRRPYSAQDATVDFTLKPCPSVKGLAISEGRLEYSIWNGANSNSTVSVTKTATWKKGSEPLRWSVRVPAGAYSYDIDADGRDARGREVECQDFFYLAVLPGATRRIVEMMYDGIGDPMPRVYIYGFAPKGSHISVVRFDESLGCGSSLSNASENQIAVERTADGFYASDTMLPDRSNGNVVMGVRVQMDASGDTRTFRLVTEYPKSILHGSPISARLDVTDEMMQSATESPGVLICTPPQQP